MSKKTRMVDGTVMAPEDKMCGQKKKSPLGRRAKGMPDEVRARKYAYLNNT